MNIFIIFIEVMFHRCMHMLHFTKLHIYNVQYIVWQHLNKVHGINCILSIKKFFLNL